MLVFSDIAVKDTFPYVIATGDTSGMDMGVLKALARAEVLPMGVVTGVESYGILYCIDLNTALIVGHYALGDENNRVRLSFDEFLGWEKIKRHRINGTMTSSECAETYLHRISREARASIPYITPVTTDESEE